MCGEGYWKRDDINFSQTVWKLCWYDYFWKTLWIMWIKCHIIGKPMCLSLQWHFIRCNQLPLGGDAHGLSNDMTLDSQNLSHFPELVKLIKFPNVLWGVYITAKLTWINWCYFSPPLLFHFIFYCTFDFHLLQVISSYLQQHLLLMETNSSNQSWIAQQRAEQEAWEEFICCLLKICIWTKRENKMRYPWGWRNFVEVSVLEIPSENVERWQVFWTTIKEYIDHTKNRLIDSIACQKK